MELPVPVFYIVLPVLVVLGGLAIFLKHKVWKRIFVTLFILALVAGLGILGYRLRERRMQTNPLDDGEIYTVARGDIAEVVEATGNLSPAAQVNLSFSIPGRLVYIRVATGDRVRKGDIIAMLDTADLELQLAQAQTGVNAAEANLEKLLAGPREEDITVAQSSLNQASVNVEELRVTLSTATEQAWLSLVQATNNLRDVQANYENIYWQNREWEENAKKWGGGDLPDAMADAEAQAWRAVENAEAARDQAQLAYEQALQREDTSVRSAQAQVTSAWANLERLQNGVAAEDIAVAQVSIEQALLSYELAQANLEKATLKVPFDGVIATVLADVHNYVSAANPIVVLLDPSSYYVDVQVDEVDIPQVQVGQEAHIFLDALPDVELLAQVTEIALSPSTAQGVITYRVRVQISDLQDAAVRPGMTANVNIVTRWASDVLIVPRRAVRIEDGQAYVERVLSDGSEGVAAELEQVPVELGLGDPFFIEIVSGLQEGDRVFVRGVVERNQIQNLIEEGPGGMRP